MNGELLQSEEQVPAVERKPEDQAYLDSKTSFELFGEELRKFSPSRKVAAQSMGMLYPFVGEAGADQMEATNMYPGALKDTIICLWLCGLKDASDLTKEEVKVKAWTPARALHKPYEALDVAMEWAIEKGMVDIESREFQQAYQVFMAIVTGVSASEFYLEMSKTSGPTAVGEEDSGPKV